MKSRALYLKGWRISHPFKKLLHILLLSLAFCSKPINAQNLLQNGDFEEYYGCPNSYFDSLKFWYSVTPNPDYFNCSDAPILNDDASAYQGTGFVGLGGSIDTMGPIESFGQELLVPILPNHGYKFSLFAKKTNNSFFWGGCSGISIYGLKFSMPKDTIIYHISKIPDSFLLGNMQENIVDTVWYEYQIIFTATDTAKYFIVTIKKDILCYAYYYLDSLQLIPYNTSTLDESNDIQYIKISPNPNVGIFNINLPDLKYQHLQFAIVNATGQLVKTVNVSNSKLNHELDCKELPNGLYNLIVKADGMPLHNTKFIIHR